MATSPDYWNHNTAYHPWLVEIAGRHRGDVLDVGCGDGLLARRLSAVSRSVTAIDTDPAAVDRAGERLAADHGVAVSCESFEAFDSGARRFDVITFVATLHHMDTRAALTKARDLLTPTGEIAVVGLAANKTVRDWAWAVSCVPVSWLGSRWHGETRDVGVRVADPEESLDDVRRIADAVLPGAWIRRGVYFRYRLRWTSGLVGGSN